jgi:hypothetical protein
MKERMDKKVYFARNETDFFFYILEKSLRGRFGKRN